MLGGLGAISAAVGTIVVICLTWRYVHINAQLLDLNRRSLDTLRESVQESSRQAEAATLNSRILSEQWSAAQRERLLPIQVALAEASAMIQAILQRLGEAEEYGIDTIISGWRVPPGFTDSTERARHISLELYEKMLGALREMNDVALLLERSSEHWGDSEPFDHFGERIRTAFARVETALETCDLLVSA